MSNREIFIDKLRQLSKEEMLERYIALLNTEKLTDYVSDLEAKLAESEKKAYSRGHSQRDIDNEIKLNALREDVSNKEKRIVELKQQLAEKEKEIMELASKVDLLESEKENLFRTLEEANEDYQDKISFAVDILEELADCSNYINSKLDFECGSYVLEKAIRDKIKSLKGKKDE